MLVHQVHLGVKSNEENLDWGGGGKWQLLGVGVGEAGRNKMAGHGSGPSHLLNQGEKIWQSCSLEEMSQETPLREGQTTHPIDQYHHLASVYCL